MTTKQESKMKMFLALRILLQTNPDIMAALPNSAEFLTMLDEAIIQIQTNSENQQYNTTGVTDNKQQLRLTLSDIALDNSSKFQAYAKYKKDTALLSVSKLTKSTLNHATDLELVDMTKGLYNKINLNLTALNMYLLTKESQTDYLEAITTFETSIPATRQIQVDKHESTKLVNQGFDQADTAVENLDVLVEMVRLTEPGFYSEYKATRKIIDKSGTLQVKGIVTDSVTNDPIVDATLQFILSGETKPTMEKQTAEKGGYKIKNLDEGIYSVNVSKVGYKTKIVSVVVSFDQLCELDVELEKS
jgi:hypothetical protein